ncbi:hypothetical protein [Dehalobacter restrictus]|uniref:Uncharacterized protein n=1 Tax=Dehalobacter restrictus TaxID=55583 RepID=A0A857DJB3_9FIRM|nr:hypothetical protein [Dehalobacter restrictus]QHA00893.1 hypothetical protein GQ588_09740 [Dehalobacter restrictus]
MLKIGRSEDTIIIGLLGGLIGTIAMDVSNLLIFKAGKTETLYGHIAGGLFVAPYRTKRRENFILGQLAHLGIGSLWGIPLVYTFKKTGKDHYLIKGAVISMLSLGTLIGGQKVGFLKKFRLTRTYYSAIWNHLLHGLVSSQTIVMLANPTMIKKTNACEKDTSFSQVKGSNIHHSLDTKDIALDTSGNP